jgi:hypothetical protein
MDIIFGSEKEEKEQYLDTDYIRFSRLRNGFIEEWVLNKYDLKVDVHSSFTSNEIYSLIFMFLILIRFIVCLTLNDDNYELLMYLGRLWQYLGVNYVHIEVLFLLWTTKFIAFHFYVIHSPKKQQSNFWIINKFLT